MVNETQILNELIAVCRDNIESVEDAAQQTKSDELQTFFNELVEHWKKILEALRAEVIYQGGIPTESGTLIGDVHRLYAKFKAAVLRNEREAVLDELEQLSSRALDTFDEVLKRELPPQAEGILRLQHGQVSEVHERILAFRKSGR